jgi:hypothetical protein
VHLRLSLRIRVSILVDQDVVAVSLTTSKEKQSLLKLWRPISLLNGGDEGIYLKFTTSNPIPILISLVYYISLSFTGEVSQRRLWV